MVEIKCFFIIQGGGNKVFLHSRVGEDFWCEVDGLSGADQVQGSAGEDIEIKLIWTLN